MPAKASATSPDTPAPQKSDVNDVDSLTLLEKHEGPRKWLPLSCLPQMPGLLLQQCRN